MRLDRKNFKDSITELDAIVAPYHGRPRGAELPQVATEKDIITGLIHQRTGTPVEYIKH